MKRTLHVINSILCVALMGLGILIIVCNRDANEDWMSIFTIVGGTQIVLAFVMFLIGALLPKDGRYISKRAQRILKVILILSVLGGNCILRSPADFDAFQSGRCAEHNGRPESLVIMD